MAKESGDLAVRRLSKQNSHITTHGFHDSRCEIMNPTKILNDFHQDHRSVASLGSTNIKDCSCPIFGQYDDSTSCTHQTYFITSPMQKDSHACLNVAMLLLFARQG